MPLGVGEHAFHQAEPVLAEHLVEALCPAETLVPRIAECDGLFVVEHGGGAVSDALTMQDAVGGELDVFGEQVELPAAHLLDDLGAHEKARARNRAAGVQRKARLAQVLRFTQEPHAIASRDPVRTEILRVAVARGSNGTTIEDLVHLAEVVHVEHVVGIEDEVSLVFVLGIVLADAGHAIVECVALADLLGVEAGEYDRASFLGDGSGVVGAVVCDYEDVDKFLRVILHADAVDKVADNSVFVTSCDEHRIAVVFLRGLLRCFAREYDKNVKELIGIAKREGDENTDIEYIHERERG